MCVCVFFVQLFGNFLKIAIFSKKRVQKLGFSIFCVLILNFENSLFGGLLKHYQKQGFQLILVFLLLQEKKKAPKQTITGISGFGFSLFLSKNGRFVTQILRAVFQKVGC